MVPLKKMPGFSQECSRMKMIIFAYLSETAIFTAKRAEETYYFEPIRAKDYLNKSAIQAGLFMVKKFRLSRVRTTLKRIDLINFKI